MSVEGWLTRNTVNESCIKAIVDIILHSPFLVLNFIIKKRQKIILIYI
jgi:hypothetical protein